MGPHVTSNACKANNRESRSEVNNKKFNILRQRTSRSGLSDQGVCPSVVTVSCTLVEQKLLKIDKLTDTPKNHRRRQRGGTRLYGEGGGGGSIRTEAIGNVSNSAKAEAVNIEKPPNAVLSDTMAPALTEPLSPTEKLSSSTAKTTLSTRSAKRASEPAISTGSSVSVVNNSTVGGREKRNRNTSTSSSTSTVPTPSTSTRVTRSKDVYQRGLEQSISAISIIPSPNSGDIAPVATAATTITKNTSPSPGGASSAGPGNIEPTKCTLNSNEPMGLSAALHNNNNKNNRNNNSKGIDEVEAQLNATSTTCEITPKGKTINNIKNTNSKSNSTEQLLADLTDDFEEAITAEICLRKQLKDSNLSKEATGNTTSVKVTSVSPPKDIFVIKASDRVASERSQATLQHMESSQSSCGKDDDHKITLTTELRTQTLETTTTTERSADKTTQDSRKGQSSYNATEATLSSKTVVTSGGTITSIQQNEAAAMMVSPPMSTDHLHHVEGIELVAQVNQKQDTTRLHILSVEELPPISTDSTMTASEVEDNLEERLSQLDGTAIVSPACGELSTTAVIGTIPATPPRTPTKQHLQQLHQQQVQQLQQQLQQTPPTPLSQQVHQHQLAQHSFTPQSSSSSMNTISSTNLPPAFMKETAASELEDQDIEEVLKALKGLDGTAGADTLCDLNVLFNEVYTLNYEEVSSQPASTSNKPNPLKDIQCEIERKQQSVQRKIDFLLRRLRKMQARFMSKHTSEEIAGLFEWSARMVAGKVGTASSGISIHSEQGPLSENINIAARPPAISWTEEKKNPVPSSQMVAMLRRLETASNAQQLCTAVVVTNTVHTNTQLRKSKKALLEMQATASTSTAITPSFSNSTDRKGETVVNTFDVKVAEEIKHVAGLLQTEMREVQNAIDSDATESSSGAESADEMVTYNNSAQQPLSIAKRATWRYSRDRAAIASRWAWLLSQIADLEIRIRQHGELHQEIMRTKGAVVCGLEEQILSGLAKANESTATTSSVNGYKGAMNIIAGSGIFKNEMGTDETTLPGSCRTRGYMPSQFRKRKLFQTTNIHTFSKKAARTSTIKCGCQWPLQPCALCTGRSDPTAPRDPPDTMMMADRVALLDSGYHPVLSFPEDINNALHLEAIARMPEWQQRVMRCQVKSIAKSVWKAEREAAAAAGHHTSKKYGGEHIVKRRYIKKKVAEDKNAVTANTVNNTPTATTTMAGGTLSTTSATATATTFAEEAAASAQTTPTPLATTSSDAGNGTGILSTSTTPLVANKLTKNAKKLHYHLVGDGVLLEPPLSPVATNHSGHSQSSHHSTNSGNSNYIHQTSDYPPQNYDPCNPNPAHSSLISNNNSNGIGIGGGSNNHKYNNYKNRKSSTAGINNAYNNLNSNYNYNNNSQYNNVNSNGNSEFNFHHTNDNWDVFAARSRTSSPTHGGSSNYHKYERSKNRTSYDIDNIVIPYSVAAATRVEILPYKEIPTPKWRVIELAERERALNNATVDTNKEELTIISSVPLKMDKKEDNIETSVPNVAVNATKTVTVNAMNQKIVASESVTITKIESKLSNVEKRNNVMKQNNVAKQMEALIGSSSTDEPVVKKSKLDSSSENHVDIATKSGITTNQVDTAKKSPDILATASTESTQCATTATIATSNVDIEKPIRSESLDEENALEDISDEAIMQRHERALAEERRKFQTYLKFPWSTRSRANRRIDSRAESSGANTPDPTSPAPQTPSVGGGDQESIPSPLAPSTPLNPLDIIPETSENALTGGSSTSNCLSKRLERRRTTSTKKDRELERRSSTPDPKELVPPYEPLKFPLTDEALDGLLKAMPVEFHYMDDSRYLEDCNNIAVAKYPRRSNWRSDSTMRRGPGKSTTQYYCDANNKRHKLNNNTNNIRRGGGGGNRQQRRQASYARGKDIIGDDDESLHDADEDDDDVDMGLEDDDDDYDYPRHHLAPDDDLYENATDSATTRGANGIDDEYEAYVGGHRNLLGLATSEGESSDTEPFADDDPNDPEWRGERDERGEKLRKNAR